MVKKGGPPLKLIRLYCKRGAHAFKPSTYSMGAHALISSTYGGKFSFSIQVWISPWPWLSPREAPKISPGYSNIHKYTLLYVLSRYKEVHGQGREAPKISPGYSNSVEKVGWQPSVHWLTYPLRQLDLDPLGSPSYFSSYLGHNNLTRKKRKERKKKQTSANIFGTRAKTPTSWEPQVQFYTKKCVKIVMR